MRKRIILAFIFVFLTAGISFPFSDEYTDGDVIVVLKNNSDAESGVFLSSVSVAESFAEASGASVKEIYSELDDGGEIFTLLHSDTMDADEFAEKLKNNSDVLAVSPNYKVYLAVENLPNESAGAMTQEDCWGVYAVNAPEAWSSGTGSSSVYVAMIDSGLDYTNPDLVNNFSESYSYSNAMDTRGHGTHVAGIIGAEGNNAKGIAGINWNVSLIAVNSLPTGSGTIADVIKGVNYVTSLIKSGVNIKVVNMSIEAYAALEPTFENLVSDPFWRSLKALDSLNKAVIVVAAGNSTGVVGQPIAAKSGRYVYPASFKGLNNMISVGSLNTDMTLYARSNGGADVAAPGVNILSTYPQSMQGYKTDNGVNLRKMTGTSMATPFVSGAAALLASINSDLTAYQIRTALVNGYNSSLSSVNEVNASSGERVFDLSEAINFYENNHDNSSVMPATPATTAYDSYAQYSENAGSSYSYEDENININDTEGGGSGCNGFTGGIFVMLIFVPLVKKLNR